MILKLTPVTKDGNITNSELIRGEFDNVLYELGRELTQLNNYRFVVVTKHDKKD